MLAQLVSALETPPPSPMYVEIENGPVHHRSTLVPPYHPPEMDPNATYVWIDVMAVGQNRGLQINSQIDVGVIRDIIRNCSGGARGLKADRNEREGSV